MAVTKPNEPISSTITIVQAAINDYHTVKDDTKLGETFHEAGRGLPLIHEALSTIRAQIHTELTHAATTSHESCNTTATLFEAAFKEVSKAPPDARLQSYVAYIDRKGKGSLVESLVIRTMEQVCILARDCAIEARMQDELIALRAASDKLARMEPSVPIKPDGVNHFANHSNGSQYNSTGGTQNNATGNGKQFVGVTFAAAVTFN